ncbi:MAG: polyhydroxyalkanoate synthesis repressor PhaR [Limnohabitans sp.]|nr:polyhydroxyalkanoate synthesis repressor PhaR [Limnohabitans sp.]
MVRKSASKSTPAASEAHADSASDNVASQPQRVIKKYPNRRLYDTKTSSYVTLTEIKQLVMQGQVFVVRDAKTGEDLTRNLLLQIILEEESAGAPMFTEAVLANIIRFYGHAMQGHMGAYLESNLQSLMLMQSKMGYQSENIVSQMQEQMQKQTAQFLNAFGLKP